MGYTIITTEHDSDNVEYNTAVILGRTEHWTDLDDKTYVKYRIGSNISTTTTPMVWDENIDLINNFIQQEIYRLYQLLLNERARLYEISYMRPHVKAGSDESRQKKIDAMNTLQATIDYLESYVP